MKNCMRRSGKSKKGKSHDSDGIRAQDIKACDEETKEMVRQIFNEIIKQNEFTPEAWKKVKIKVLRQKGDAENVGNYRPICSLPVLYVLSSTILYRRLYPRLEQQQSTSRRHPTPLHTNQFEKHSKSCGIKHDSISFLKEIYRDQKAFVQTDV